MAKEYWKPFIRQCRFLANDHMQALIGGEYRWEADLQCTIALCHSWYMQPDSAFSSGLIRAATETGEIYQSQLLETSGYPVPI